MTENCNCSRLDIVCKLDPEGEKNHTVNDESLVRLLFSELPFDQVDRRKFGEFTVQSIVNKIKISNWCEMSVKPF